MSRSNASRNGSGSTMIYPITLVHRTGSTPGWGQLLLVVAGLRLNDDLLARPGHGEVDPGLFQLLLGVQSDALGQAGSRSRVVGAVRVDHALRTAPGAWADQGWERHLLFEGRHDASELGSEFGVEQFAELLLGLTDVLGGRADRIGAGCGARAGTNRERSRGLLGVRCGTLRPVAF